MKKIITILFLFQITFSIAQKVNFPIWGNFSEYEKNLMKYEIDSTAYAVILNETGYSYCDEKSNYDINTEVYVRIKILNKEAFKNGNIDLMFYKKEFISKLKATTTNIVNGINIVEEVKKDHFYTTEIDDKWSKISFTFPNLKEGSIIEYSYVKKSPYHYNFGNGWTFQSEIPTIKSSFYAKIPGFWNYNIVTVNVKNESIKRNELINECVEVDGATAQCLFILVEEENIPAFIEEDFSTSKENYLKKIKFELNKISQTDGSTKNYTKTWKDVENYIFKESQLGKDYNKTNFIKSQMPIDILNENDELVRAKKVYDWTKEHYNWNEWLRLWEDFNAKKIFESRVGTVTEINSMLINALLAANLNADIALLSTRENGKVTKFHPIIEDFNYLAAYLKINETYYLLDASDKFLPFGFIPFHCLNNDVRIFPNKEPSYWVEILTFGRNETRLNAIGTINEDGTINSKIRIYYNGYNAFNTRKEINDKTLEGYKKDYEKNENFEYSNFNFENIDDLENSLHETFEVKTKSEIFGNNKIYLNPFIYDDFIKNPFTQESRSYPIDFGFTRKYTYSYIYKIPEGFRLLDGNINKKSYLPLKGGELNYIVEVINQKLSVQLMIDIKKIIFESTDYKIMKMFFADLIKYQNQNIVLIKD